MKTTPGSAASLSGLTRRWRAAITTTICPAAPGKPHAEFTFTGTNAVLRGLKAPWCGTADISVDGTVVATVDTYAPQQENQAVWYDTGELPYGAHTIRITVNAAKNDASEGKWGGMGYRHWR